MRIVDAIFRHIEQEAQSFRDAMSSKDQRRQSMYRSTALRRKLLDDQRSNRPSIVPGPFHFTQHTALLSFLTYRTMIDAGGLQQIPICTQALLAASCLPFCRPGGFSLQRYGLSPFMVREHRQLHRLVSSTFLHQNIDHMLSNASGLLVSSTYLERCLGRKTFAATVASLTASSQGLYVLLTWLECKWLGIWKPYFLQSAVGSSGLCFALQVVADHLRGGNIAFMGFSGWEMPSQFYCWPSLAITEILVPSASTTGHLCGILAGLLQVYLPKAVRRVRALVRPEDHPHQSNAQARSGIVTRHDSVQVAGHRIPNVLVHAACFGAFMLYRSFQHSRGRSN